MRPHESTRFQINLQIALILALGVLMATLVLFHVPGINGPWYWKWAWRRLPVWPYYPLMIVAAAPTLAAVMLPALRQWPMLVLLMLMISVIGMKLASAAVLSQPMSFDPIGETIEDRNVTSYYTDAGAIAASYPTGYGWLGAYDQILRLPEINLHTRNKPAGPVAYFFTAIRLGGYKRHTAIVCGIVMAALATLSVPATWWLVRLFTGNDAAAIRAAALLALCPGFVLMFPMFDPIYIVFGCAIVGLWHLATTRDRAVWSIATGAALFITTFFAYTPLVLGVFMLSDSFLLAPISPRQRLIRLMKHAALAIAACVFAYATLWFFTGYDPVATFRQSLANHHWQLERYGKSRVYPWTIVFDLTDFLLGAGWIVPALATWCVAVRRSRLLLMCMAMPVVVALLGVLQAETARVWNFLLPLVILPAALELERWPRRAQVAFYFVMLGVLLVVGQNLKFL